MTSFRWVVPVVAAALVMPWRPVSAWSGTAVVTVEPDAAGPVQLEVDASGLGGYEGVDTQIYETIARDALVQGLRKRGVEPGSGAAADRIAVVLGWRDFDASIFEVVVKVTPAGGETKTLPLELCEDCTDDDLATMVEAQLDRAFAALHGEEPEEVGPAGPTGATGPVGPTGATGPTGDEDGEGERKGLAPLAGVGIGLSALGIGGLVAGGVLLGKPDVVEQAPDGGDEVDRTSYRPPAIGTLVAGGVLFATGITLIVVGQLRHGKKKDAEGSSSSRRSSQRFTLAPAVGPAGAALQLSGRF